MRLCDSGCLTQAAELTDDGGERVVHHTLQLAADALRELAPAEVTGVDVPLHQRHGLAPSRSAGKNTEKDTVSSTPTGSVCGKGYYSTGRGRKDNTDGPVDGELTEMTKCPKARRLVASGREIKALEKERCQLIPGRLVTGPAGIVTQTAFHGYGQRNTENGRETRGNSRRHQQHRPLLLLMHDGDGGESL